MTYYVDGSVEIKIITPRDCKMYLKFHSFQRFKVYSLMFQLSELWIACTGCGNESC